MNTCPHVITTGEGTSYCALAESSVDAYREQAKLWEKTAYVLSRKFTSANHLLQQIKEVAAQRHTDASDQMDAIDALIAADAKRAEVLNT